MPVEFHARLLKYHANIANADFRDRAVHMFSERGGCISIVTATGASLGKGLDKPDIRAVVLWGAPHFAEDYIQAIGRAGRDKRYGVAMTIMYYFYAQVRLASRSHARSLSSHYIYT